MTLSVKLYRCRLADDSLELLPISHANLRSIRLVLDSFSGILEIIRCKEGREFSDLVLTDHSYFRLLGNQDGVLPP